MTPLPPVDPPLLVVHPYQITKSVQSSFTESVRYALLSSSDQSSLFVSQETPNMLLCHDAGELSLQQHDKQCAGYQ